jgi:hypothetical protein
MPSYQDENVNSRSSVSRSSDHLMIARSGLRLRSPKPTAAPRSSSRQLKRTGALDRTVRHLRRAAPQSAGSPPTTIASSCWSATITAHRPRPASTACARAGGDDTIALLTDVSAEPRSASGHRGRATPSSSLVTSESPPSTTSRRMRSLDAILTFVRPCTNARRSGPQPQRCPSVRANARLPPT